MRALGFVELEKSKDEDVSMCHDEFVADPLIMKLKQLYHAFRVVPTIDFKSFEPNFFSNSKVNGVELNFRQVHSKIEMQNRATLLISLIGSIKDHLKSHCQQQGIRFSGEDLINSNRSVALIHDLWNVDKHATLNRPPRSGFTPALKHLKTTLRLETESTQRAKVNIALNPKTGKLEKSADSSGTAFIIIDGLICNESGAVVSGFRQACDEAVEAWITLARSSGVVC